MAFAALRRVSFLRSGMYSLLSLQCSKFSTSRASNSLGHDRGHPVTNKLHHLSPLFSENGKDDMKDCKIELIDDATWHISSSLADAWSSNNGHKALKMRSSFCDTKCEGDADNGMSSSLCSNKEDPDFDEIEDMRIRGNLFYKLDKDSKEYEEYKFDFHGRKFTRNEKDRRVSKENKKENPREIKKNAETKPALLLVREKDKNLSSSFPEVRDSSIGKKQRTLTFNQQTAPYHEPFCLDIYISTGSVRASIIHRATSNVVAVSHSISKDMKFDLGSTKNKRACSAVGKVLAQRALADDIHNVVYTPRKGEKLEGRLQIVLKSIVDGGVDVKVKLKQKKMRRVRCLSPRTQDQH